MVVAEDDGRPPERERQQVRVTRKSLQAVLEQCQRALDLLSKADLVDEDGKEDMEDGSSSPFQEEVSSRASPSEDCDADQLCDLIKSRVESPNFLEKLGSIHMSVCHNISGDETASWDIITAADLWEDMHTEREGQSGQDEYVFVGQEDIVDGMACFMAAYLLSLKQAKDLNPHQLQEALSKTFSVKKKKGKLRLAWDGSKVVYNIASWGATAIGIYQNPALLSAASSAFWTSCRAIAKLF